MRRVLGNVGRPGITLLTPPTTQMLRPLDQSLWRIASGGDFDYTAEDRLSSTSLHLSFTEYYRPMHQVGKQSQDGDVFFLESYVSVHDAGVWVGDIDILEAVSSMDVIRPTQDFCRHSAEERQGRAKPRSTKQLPSVETWHEILDPPTEVFVVRAYGNWTARLAATAMLRQTLPRNGGPLGHGQLSVTVCPPDFCWTCEMGVYSSHSTTASIGVPSVRRAYVYRTFDSQTPRRQAMGTE